MPRETDKRMEQRVARRVAGLTPRGWRRSLAARGFNMRGALGRGGGLRVAPIRLRVLASLIDTAVLICPVGGTVAALASSAAGRQRLRSLAEAPRSTSWRLAMRLCSLAISVLFTLRRSPGAQIAGIRVVDARTGGPVSIQQAIVREGVGPAWQLLARRLTAPAQERARQRLRDLQPADIEVLIIRREHAGDPDALGRALMSHHEQSAVRPYASCLPALAQLALALAIETPGLFSPQHQRLADKLAGTLVIRER